MTGSEATQRAAILLDLGRAEEALRLVAPFLASGADPAPHAVAVVALLALRRHDDAARAASAALGTFGPVPELARVASYAFRDAGAPDQALAAARAGAQQAPEWVPGLLALIEAELALGHRAEVMAALATALSLDPNSPDVRLVAADVAWAGGERKLAREHCLAALKFDPTSVAALRGLGLLDERRNRNGSAARWYAQALRLRPGDQELAGRVRALFGRLLGSVTVALVVASFVVFIAFMAQADPAPGQGVGDLGSARHAPASPGSSGMPGRCPQPRGSGASRCPYEPPDNSNNSPKLPQAVDKSQQNPGGGSDLVFWALWIVGFGGCFAVTIWSSVRGVPRVVLDALVSETRTYRRVRRCARLTLAYAVTVIATVLAALAPVGSAADRLAVVFLLWLASMVLMVITCVTLRTTFGYGQKRAATAHPRDRSLAG